MQKRENAQTPHNAEGCWVWWSTTSGRSGQLTTSTGRFQCRDLKTPQHPCVRMKTSTASGTRYAGVREGCNVCMRLASTGLVDNRKGKKGGVGGSGARCLGQPVCSLRREAGSCAATSRHSNTPRENCEQSGDLHRCMGCIAMFVSLHHA